MRPRSVDGYVIHVPKEILVGDHLDPGCGWARPSASSSCETS